MRSLGDLERALSLRSLAFRARHGDDDAVASLREAATFAAAALDGERSRLLASMRGHAEDGGDAEGVVGEELRAQADAVQAAALQAIAALSSVEICDS